MSLYQPNLTFSNLPQTTPITHKTLPKVFCKTAKMFGRQVAIRNIQCRENQPDEASYQQKFEEIIYNWKEYKKNSQGFAKACIAAGLQPQRAVTIQGSNSAQWMFANMGTIMAGGLAVGVYPTNGAELSQHAVKNSGADIVVVEDEKQLLKYKGLNDTSVKCFVVWNNINSAKISADLAAPVYSWDDFMNLGKSVSRSTLKDRISEQKADDVCSLMYTSGTTGLPKAAALTHDNLVWTAKTAGKEYNFNENHLGISYLPMSHIAAQMMDIVAPAIFGFSVNIAPADALKGPNLKQHLIHTKPTYFLAVPRVWEKFMEAMQENTTKLTGLKKFAGDVRASCLNNVKGNNNVKDEIGFGCFNQINKICLVGNQILLKVLNQLILKAIGLSNCQIAASGAGAIDPKIVGFFKDYGIKIIDLYGLSETTGPATMSRNLLPGSSGLPLPGTSLIIADQDSEGKGEIRIAGRHVFKKYWNDPESTKNAFDANGYFCTGDEGKLDVDGNLFITGRLKELIKTSGGENIPPVRIEQRIKNELPIIDQAVVIGNKRNYLTCLLTLQTELDSENNPTSKLAPTVVDCLSKIGSSAQTIAEAQKDNKVLDYLMKGIKLVNQNADSQAQSIQKITLVPENFSVVNGLMTPTQKLKRSLIENHYAKEIEMMYSV